MGNEDIQQEQQAAPVSDIIQDLKHAPPEQPNATDRQVADATQQAAAARNLSSVLRDPTGVLPSPSPIQPSEFDSGQARAPFNATAAPGSFADKMGSALNNAQQDGSASALMSQPMGWAKLMLAASLHGLSKAPARPSTPQVPTTGAWSNATSNATDTTPTQVPQAPKRNFGSEIMASLGDSSGGGGFIGAAKRGSERQREEMKDRQQMATSAAQMLHEQQLVHIQGENQIASAAASGKEGLNAILSAESPGQLLAEGKNSDELKAMIQNGELDPSKQTVFLTGRTLTGRDANGQPMFRSTYSVVEPHGDVELSEKQADYLNSHLNRNLTGKTEDKPGQILPAVQFNSLWQQAQGAEAAKAARDLALAKNGIEVRKAQIGTDADSIASNPLVVNALGGHMGSPDDPYALIKAYNTIISNPKLLNDQRLPPNFPTVFATFAGGGDPKNFTMMQENYAKAQAKNTNTTLQMLDDFEKKPETIEGKTPAYSAAMKSIIADPKQSPEVKQRASSALAIIKETEANELQFETSKAGAKKKVEDSFDVNSNLTGDDYLKTLPLPQQQLLTSIAEGRNATANIQNRKGEITPLGQALIHAFPDFDITKVKDYQKVRTDFTSGPTSKNLTAYGTAMSHGRSMYDNTGLKSYIPGTDEYKRYHQDAHFLATEVAKALNPTGAATESSIKGAEDALTSTTNRKAAIENAEQLLSGKLPEIKQRWANAQVRPSYQPPMPTLSQEAQDNADYIKNHGQVAQGSGQPPAAAGATVGAAAQQPTNSVHIQKPDGTFIYVPSANVAAAMKLGGKVVQ